MAHFKPRGVVKLYNFVFQAVPQPRIRTSSIINYHWFPHNLRTATPRMMDESIDCFQSSFLSDTIQKITNG